MRIALWLAALLLLVSGGVRAQVGCTGCASGGGGISAGVAGSAQTTTANTTSGFSVPAGGAGFTVYTKISGGTPALVWSGPDPNAGGSGQLEFTLNSSTGALTYTGANPTDVLATFFLNGDLTGASDCNIALFLNDTLTYYDVLSSTTASERFGQGSAQGPFTLNTNDIVEGRISCVTLETVSVMNASLDIGIRGAGIQGSQGTPGVAGTGCEFDLTHTASGAPALGTTISGNTVGATNCNTRSVTQIQCRHTTASVGATGSTDVTFRNVTTSQTLATISIPANALNALGTPTASKVNTYDVLDLNVTAVTSGGTAPDGLKCTPAINTT